MEKLCSKAADATTPVSADFELIRSSLPLKLVVSMFASNISTPLMTEITLCPSQCQVQSERYPFTV